MDNINIQSIGAIFGAVSVVAGTVYSIQKILREIKKSKEAQNELLLREAKEEVTEAKIELEGKIQALRIELQNLEQNVEKDVKHLKETFNNEIRSLGEKIETLRDELRQQHTQLIDILSNILK